MFPAKYDGECAFCGESIEAGALMGLASGTSHQGYEVNRAPACQDCAEELGDESRRRRWGHKRVLDLTKTEEDDAA